MAPPEHPSGTAPPSAAQRRRSGTPRVRPLPAHEDALEVTGSTARTRAPEPDVAHADPGGPESTGGGSAAHGSRGRWTGRRLALLLGGGGLVAVLVAGLAVQTVRLSRVSSPDEQRSVLAAARSFAVEAATYDYRHVDQDYQTVVDHSTGSFRQQFLANSTAQKRKIVDFQGQSIARVDDAAVRDLSGDTATVILFLDQKVINSSLQAPRLEQDRLRLTLVRRGGAWLVSVLETI